MHDSVQRLGHIQGKYFDLMLNQITIIPIENQNSLWFNWSIHRPLFSYLISKSFKFSCKVKALLFSPIGTPSTFLNKIGQHYFPFFDNLSLVLHFTQPKLYTYKHIDTHIELLFSFLNGVLFFCCSLDGKRITIQFYSQVLFFSFREP